MYSKTINSPVGRLKLITDNDALTAVLWGQESESADEHPVLIETEKQLQEYFAGLRNTFQLPLFFKGTAFQEKVWNALLTISYGETRSYAQIAAQIDNPAAVRAVGAANSNNPISIITPCHRVIGADGTLTGYAGGLKIKAFLLNREGHQYKHHE